ncbi:TolC family outer membrane protein [Desulfovibrio sp. OttesenSCG-928-F07]|nr:TolC family outer membrane protein [Desulfovibrio sp. OttesenSCG-928-F07]
MKKPVKKSVIAAFACAFILGGSFAAMADDAAEEAKFGIRDSIEATLRNNPTVKAFQEYRQAAEFDLERAHNGYFPRVDLRAGIGMEQWEDPTTRQKNYDQDKRKYYGRSDASLTVTQNLFTGFATSSRVDYSEAMLESAVYRLLDNAEILSLEAILAHIEVHRQRQLLALAEVNVRNHQSILESQIERQAAGVANLSDVTQTQARLSRAESTLAETKMALENAYTKYRRLTGVMPSALETPIEPEYAFPSLDNALANSMTNNAKVRSKRADVDSLYAQKELDKAAFYPRLYVEAGAAYNWQNGNAITDQWNTAIQLRTEWNLYNGGYDKNVLNANKARIRQSNRELQAQRDSLAEETENTWAQWQVTKELTIFYANAVLYNTQTRDMYLDQFNVGQRSLMDVLDSENELFNTSMQLVTAQLNEIAAQYRLIALGGRLFSYFDIDKELINVATDGDDGTDRDLARDVINNHAFMPDEELEKESAE